MPRKEYDVSVLLDYLVKNKYDIIVDVVSGEIRKPSEDIWKRISQLMDFKISPKNVYTIVKCNRFEVREKIGLISSIPQAESPNKPTNSNIDSGSDVSEQSEDNLLSFNITLTAEEWTNIYQPTDQYYKRSDNKNRYRAYLILKPNIWTRIMHTHLVEQTRLSCPIIYKRANIYNEGNLYMDIIGHCPTCQSNLKGILNNKPESADARVIIHFSYFGEFKFCMSEIKRKLTGEQKENAIKKMIEQGQSAAFVRRNLAKNLMNFGEQEPSNLPSANALSVLKCKTIKQGLHNEDVEICN